MANVELAVYNLLETFYKYSGKEGDALKLNQKELTTLLQQELPSIVQVRNALETSAFTCNTHLIAFRENVPIQPYGHGYTFLGFQLKD